MVRLLAAAAVVLSMAGLVAQDYPHAFPRTGTRQLVDNARVSVWEVNWPHGVSQPYHRHRYDMAGVYLRYGDITVTNPDGTANTGQRFEVPRPYFQRKGITHKEEAMGKPGDPERLAIMIDLKDVPESTAPLSSGTPTAFPRDGATNVLENERVRMWDFTWREGQPAVARQYLHDSVEVIVTGGTFRVRTPDGREVDRVVAPKDARFIPRGQVESAQAVSGSPRAITVEIK
ncbi:MAG: hypothetical protein OEW19_09895 [Acidobacteriota bacterium]|nr:hypothetical protein [Acidobacteriota bacterium]